MCEFLKIKSCTGSSWAWNEVLNRKRERNILKVAFCKFSAWTGFQVFFKCTGFFFTVKGDCRLNAPWFEFWSVRHFSCVVFGKTGVQIFRNSRIMVGFGGYIDQNMVLRRFVTELHRKNRKTEIRNWKRLELHLLFYSHQTVGGKQCQSISTIHRKFVDFNRKT